MNPLHLLWIVPLAATLGFLFAAILQVSKASDETPKKSISN